LTAVLAARYNAEQKLLDLSSLGTDETLKSLGTFESQALAEKSFKALVHLAGSEYKDPEERRVAIQAVSLARNDIRDVEEVYALAKSLRHLRRLDLSGNNLENLAKLSKWRDEFRYLEELHLAGNPVANQPNYAAEMVKWFPCLQILDGQQVRTPEQAAEALKAMSPSPVPQFPSNVRDGDNGVAGIFLRTFFPLFDNDRSALAAQFYDEDSWFSLAIIASSGRDLPWQKYQKFSRNVQKLGSRNPASLQRLFTGGNLIADLWKSLPNTQHPSVDQPEQWLIDCHTFPHLADPNSLGTAVGLIINVNGQFEEADPADGLRGIRTFSRTFILGPSKIGAPHPYRVISDELTLHKWTPQPVQAVQPIQPVQPVQPVQPNALPSDALKAQLIMELSKRTGMNAQYSEMCLTGAANWNFDMALRSFEEQRANLPPAAFISPAA
jgi:nuclear RNA export factor